MIHYKSNGYNDNDNTNDSVYDNNNSNNSKNINNINKWLNYACSLKILE